MSAFSISAAPDFAGSTEMDNPSLPFSIPVTLLESRKVSP